MRPLFRHLVHVLLPLVLWVVNPWWPLQLLAAFLLFFAIFSLVHDAMHGALGLPRAANERLLTWSGIFMGVSGHAARRAHLVHHARPLTEEDPEGNTARWGAWAALRAGPANYLGLRAWGLAHAPHERGLQEREWCAVLLFFTALMLCPAGRTYLGVVLALHATMPLWAAYLPHHPPKLVFALAAALARLGFSVPTTFVTHELHHQHPKLDAFTVARRWRTLENARQEGEEMERGGWLHAFHEGHHDVAG